MGLGSSDETVQALRRTDLVGTRRQLTNSPYEPDRMGRARSNPRIGPIKFSLSSRCWRGQGPSGNPDSPRQGKTPVELAAASYQIANQADDQNPGGDADCHLRDGRRSRGKPRLSSLQSPRPIDRAEHHGLSKIKDND